MAIMVLVKMVRKITMDGDFDLFFSFFFFVALNFSHLQHAQGSG